MSAAGPVWRPIRLAMTLSATAFDIRTGAYEYVRDEIVSPVARITDTR
jgi:hypothetical protein